MKKQILMITILSAVLCLSGCGENSSNTSPSAESGTTTALITTTTTTESTITTTSTPVADSTDPLDPDNLGERLFGGYVDGYTDVKMEPDAASLTMITIPDGLQIEVYDSGIDGWFKTEHMGVIGYIDASVVFEIEPTDPAILEESQGGYIAADTATVPMMNGTTSYAKVIAEIPAETQVMYYPDPDNPQLCVVSYQDHIGYVASKYIKDIEAYDPSLESENAGIFLGNWQCDRCSISIQKQGTDYAVAIHWANSAFEDNVWTYLCTLSDDNTRLECTEGGTLVQINTDQNKTETRTTVYTDGTAVFTKKGSTLFWQDGKEDIARQMGFEQIG